MQETTTESTEMSRATVQRLLAAMQGGDMESATQLLTVDVVWQPPASLVAGGMGPFRGREEVAAALFGGVASEVVDVSTMRMDVRDVIADGGKVVVLLTMSAKAHSGADYRNDYCWVYTIEHGQVSRIDEYVDTLHVANVFGAE